MSSTNKTTNYQLSQFVGTDIPSILNDYNGDMRKIDTAIKEVAIAGGDSATAIAELQSTTARHTTEISGINSNVNSISGRVLGIEDKIPANASSENKLITAQDIPEIPSVEQLEQDVASLQTNVGELQEEVSDMGGDVKAIQLCVPATASESNKFATMADVGGSAGLFRNEEEINLSSLSNSSTFGDFLDLVYDTFSALKTRLGWGNSSPYPDMRIALFVTASGWSGVFYPSGSYELSFTPYLYTDINNHACIRNITANWYTNTKAFNVYDNVAGTLTAHEYVDTPFSNTDLDTPNYASLLY